MSLNLSYALQEVNKKIENLSVAHDKLTSIVAAQSHIIKTLKTYHADDFKARKEEQIRRKKESQNISSNKSLGNSNNQNVNQKTQKGFDLEYEQMKQQMALLQSHLAQLTATPITAQPSSQTQTPQPVDNSSDNSAKVV